MQMSKKHIRAAVVVTALASGCLRAAVQRPEIYIDRGACPFECCTYRTWIAEDSIRLLERPDLGAAQVGMLQRGDTVVAETGHTASVPVPFVLRRAIRWEGRDFPAGDTLWVLSYMGEGFFNVRYKDEVISDFCLGFSPHGGTYGTRCDSCAIGHLERELESEWWARLRLPDGTVAWTNQPFSFGGIDACGDAIALRGARTGRVGILQSDPPRRSNCRATGVTHISSYEPSFVKSFGG
jgi:hypothetical protein